MRFNKRLINKYAYVLFGLAAFLIILKYDLVISSAITSLRSPFLDSIMFLVEKLSIAAIVVIPLVIILRDKNLKKIRNWSISLLSAYALTLLVKVIVARDRPFALGINTPFELIDPEYTKWDFSFPSNHASVSFASFFFMPSKLMKGFWLCVSLLIIFSRVYFGLHYLGDVIMGTAIGLGVSYLITKYSERVIEVRALNNMKYRRNKVKRRK